jgi:hypothetical protein
MTNPYESKVDGPTKAEWKKMVIDGHTDAGPLTIIMYRYPVMFWLMIVSVFLTAAGLIWLLLGA